MSVDINIKGCNWISHGVAAELWMLVWIVAATLQNVLQSKEM
jgi:hypothetical protein